MRVAVCVLTCIAVGAADVSAQEQNGCRFLCAPAFRVEPTITITNVFGSPRVQVDDAPPVRERRETEFEVILSMDLPTRISWFGFTVEAIFLPFDRSSTPEIEFETNFTWLSPDRTRGWLSSHVDVVDKFSEAERPGDRRPYTHKLNLELDTSVALFKWLPEGRWLRGVEVEGSLDYVVTGLPKAGDRVDDVRFIDKANPWSFSIVFVLPIAPL